MFPVTEPTEPELRVAVSVRLTDRTCSIRFGASLHRDIVALDDPLDIGVQNE